MSVYYCLYITHTSFCLHSLIGYICSFSMIIYGKSYCCIRILQDFSSYIVRELAHLRWEFSETWVKDNTEYSPGV